MWTDLKAAARWALIVGAKAAIIALMLLFAISWFLGDYYVVRERALNGQRAFEYIAQVQQQQAQQRQQAPGETRAPPGDASESSKP